MHCDNGFDDPIKILHFYCYKQILLLFWKNFFWTKIKFGYWTSFSYCRLKKKFDWFNKNLVASREKSITIESFKILVDLTESVVVLNIFLLWIEKFSWLNQNNWINELKLVSIESIFLYIQEKSFLEINYFLSLWYNF